MKVRVSCNLAKSWWLKKRGIQSFEDSFFQVFTKCVIPLFLKLAKPHLRSPSFVEVQSPPDCQGAWSNHESDMKNLREKKRKCLNLKSLLPPRLSTRLNQNVSYFVVFLSVYLSRWPPPRESRARAAGKMFKTESNFSPYLPPALATLIQQPE